MRRPTVALPLVLVTLTAVGCAAPGGAVGQLASAPPASTGALAVDSALRTIARTPLWPGFSPLASPVAIFDGTRTYLFRHPSPPAGYGAVSGRSDVVVRDARDPAITANSSAQLGGAATATVMLGARSRPSDAAALTVHELFHVYQRARHPSWQGNEADLFTYPVDDSMALALRREETSALSRALGAGADSARCWARAFADARRRRFAAIGAAPAAYERGTELNEGLARYVEARALGAAPTLDATDAPAAEVRQRSYLVGAAVAGMLDRVRPDWRETLERTAEKGMPPLDSLLEEAAARGGPSLSCAPDPAERARWAAQAGADVRALAAERAAARANYLGRPGGRIVVEADSGLFFPAGFDPLNVSRVTPTEILHTRFLKLQGALGTIEVLGGSALTAGAPGRHPLFNGVRRVTIAGLAAPPSMRDSAGVLAVDAPGVAIRLRGAKADIAGDTVRLTRR